MRGGRVEVRHREERIRRRLDPYELHVVGRRSRLVELDMAYAPARELVEEDAGAVVRALRERDRVTRLQQREHETRRGPGARRIEQCVAAVELPERTLGFRNRRRRVARVVELARLTALVGPDRRAVERHTPTVPTTYSTSNGFGGNGTTRVAPVSVQPRRS